MQDILIFNLHPATNPVICKYLQPSGLLKLILAFSAMAEAWARYSSGQKFATSNLEFFSATKKGKHKGGHSIPFPLVVGCANPYFTCSNISNDVRMS